VVKKIMADSDYEIIEPDDYRGEGDQEFSHQALIMGVMKKCADAGCKEMRTGYFNEKTDRFGNINRIYVEDTRKNFIESVKTAIMFIECDYDDESKKKIEALQEELKKIYEEYLKIEKEDIENAPSLLKKQRVKVRIYHREGCLNPQLQYFQEYLEKEVEYHRKIFSELKKLTKRLNFYEGYDLEA
jgi:uncharacterized protein YqgQ